MSFAFEKPVLHLVSNSDDRFFPGLAVAVASAVAAASGRFDYHFIILDGGVDGSSLDALGGTIAAIGARLGIRVTLEAIALDETRLAAFPERRGSRMTYAKLILPELLNHLDSIVYLDADVLCFSGIESVIPPTTDPPYLLAGAKDYFGTVGQDCPWPDQLPAADRALPYINCGVLWMNLTGLREMEFTRQAIDALTAVGSTRYGDQTVFNFLCRGRSFILPRSINHRTELGSTEPLCGGDLDLNLHYIGSPKPWLGLPRTGNWLAHRLWHQARSALFPETGPPPDAAPPHDERKIRRKSWLYALTNPSRAAHYRNDLRSLEDPGNIVAKAQDRWKNLSGISTGETE